MTAEREAMTLEQVRDFCRLQSKEFGYWHEQRQFEKMADAIDAHLSRAAEPVAFVEMVEDEWKFGLTAYGRQLSHNLRFGAHLFTHPPEPARDSKRLDWLDAHPRLSTIVVNGVPTECYFYGVAGAPGLKLREVIDAAMAQESGE